MVLAREMGLSEEEFFHSDPIFFNECASKFADLQRKKGGIRIG